MSKITLKPGDYVMSRDIRDEEQYRAIARAFMAAGCVDDYSDPARMKEGDGLWWDMDGDLDAGMLTGVHRGHMLRRLTPDQVLGTDDGGWINWHGGEMPVPYGTLVDVEYRDGKVAYGLRAGDSSTMAISGTTDRTAVNWFDAGPASIIRYRLHHTNTASRLEAARRELEAAQAAYEAECRQWEPEGGDWMATPEKDVPFVPGYAMYDKWGRSGFLRPTRQLAEQARDAMRVHNRALAYVHEHAPEWDGSEPWFVQWNVDEEEYIVDAFEYPFSQPIGTVTGPRHVMERLAEDLNSGRVRL